MTPVIKWFETIDSTNNEALREFERSDDFTVFSAYYQTNGRGQKGNSWESAAGRNLTFSILLKPVLLRPQNQFLISQIVTVGIVRYLHTKGVLCKIKWPNDIYFNDKKICGILIENYLSGDKMSGSIVGIGLNINQRVFASDAPNPVSLTLITGEEYNLKAELQLLISEIRDLYLEFIAINTHKETCSINDEYHNLLYRLNEFHKYRVVETGEIIEAKITGIDKNACVVLQGRDSVCKRYHFKEIAYIL